MKYLLYSLIFCVIACAPEPKDGGHAAADLSTDDMSQSIDQSPPYYLAKQCKRKSDIKERRLCSDAALLQEIDAIVLPIVPEVKNLKSAKLIYEFDIQTNGRLKNVALKSPVHPKLDNAVGEFLRNTRWEPARHNGKKVEIRRRLPIYLDGK